ncbi:MAG: hypothetical protein WEA61_04820 [Anaerolineales bacterium]
MALVKIEIGKPINMELDTRYFQFNSSFAIRDIYDAFVELITNCDDSYNRLSKKRGRSQNGGPILIEHAPKRNAPSVICVKDRAEGMTLREMVNKLGNVGKRHSELGDRGFMARGVKDCTALGEMLVESIKNGRFYAVEITKNAKLIPQTTPQGSPTSPELRKKLGLRREENGTSVTLYVDPQYRVPQSSTLIRDLPWHYALRFVLSENSPTKLTYRNLNGRSKKIEIITYRPPEAALLVDEIFEVSGYPEAKGLLKLWKSPTPFETPGDKRFRRSGFLIKGSKAVYECSLLLPEFESDPLGARYFGVIECPFIDTLLEEYDFNRAGGGKHRPSNPSLLVDPNRQSGLLREHPFTNAFLQRPAEKLREQIKNDRQSQQKDAEKIENQETRNRLDKLARLASEFLEGETEDLIEGQTSGEPDSAELHSKGISIVPRFARMKVGEEKQFWVYIENHLISKNITAGTIEIMGEAIGCLTNPFQILPHPTKPNLSIGKFKMRAFKVSVPIYIQTNIEGMQSAGAYIEVVERGGQSRDFTAPIEFEHMHYSVKLAGKRTVRLFARYPELIHGKTALKVWSGNNDVAEVLGSNFLLPVAETNYAEASIRLIGRKLNGKTKIYAQLDELTAEASVKVIEKEPGETPIKIEFSPEDFGNFRAQWAIHQGRPNLLLVSSNHDSIRRYLGPGPEYEGQNSPAFRILLAEIVAESVCRKLLLHDSEKRPWDYRLAELKQDSAIVSDVLARFHRRFRDFVTKAHAAMLSAGELSRISHPAQGNGASHQASPIH